MEGSVSAAQVNAVAVVQRRRDLIEDIERKRVQLPGRHTGDGKNRKSDQRGQSITETEERESGDRETRDLN